MGEMGESSVGTTKSNKSDKPDKLSKSTSAKPGDVVSVTTDTETLSGIYLQRPQILGDNIFVLKLETGYNIGIDKKTIKSITVKTPYQKPTGQSKTHPHNPNLPTVAVLSFGGTISSRVDYRTGGVVADYTADDFFAMMPELSAIANIKTAHHSNMMSEDMTPANWEQIAQAITPYLVDKSIAGVVVTQGTDTLHYSTSAMSFALQQLNKPVIFTAAQRSIDRGSSDAFMNLICAVQAAAKFEGAVVASCMHESSNDDACLLIRGTRVRKMHTSRRDAFRPINEPALARVHPDGRITVINSNYTKRLDVASQTPVVKASFASDVGLLYVHPGMSADIVEHYVKNKYRGLVVAATALGHVPQNLLGPLTAASKNGMTIVIATQTIYGRVHPYVYSRLRDQSMEGGMLFLEDILIETAFAKLSWVLAHTQNKSAALALMKEKLAGEFSDGTLYNTYLI